MQIKSEYFDVTYASTPETLGKLTLHTVVDLSCIFKKTELENAIAEVIGIYPVMGCRYVRKIWRDAWVSDSNTDPRDILTIIDTDDDFESQTVRHLPEDIDPHTIWPWRVTCLCNRKQSRLIVSVLHQVTDAAGAFSLVRAFAASLMGVNIKFKSNLIMERGLRQVARAMRWVDIFKVLCLAPLEWMQPMILSPFLANTAVPVDNNRTSVSTRMYKTVCVSMDDGSALRRKCKAVQGTINDALVAALAIVTKRICPKGNISGIYTINLRQHLENETPQPANMSVITMLALKRKHVTDFSGTLRAAVRETSKHKSQLIGLPFLFGILCICWIPHFMVRIFTRFLGQYAAFAAIHGMMVTNIGRIDDYIEPFGDLAENAFLIGPYIKGLRIPVIAATGFRDKLTMQICGFETPMAARIVEVENLLNDILPGNE